MKQLIVAAVISCLVWVSLLTLARQIGMLRYDPLLEKLGITREGDDPVCWRGLCPGKTTVQQCGSRSGSS